MVNLLYTCAIISGLIGLGGIIFFGEPLTAESAPLLTAKAVLAMAFVVIPYCTARAIERVCKGSRASKSAPQWEQDYQHAQSKLLVHSEPRQSYLDYFFTPNPQPEWWDSTPGHEVQVQKNRPNHRPLRSH